MSIQYRDKMTYSETCFSCLFSVNSVFFFFVDKKKDCVFIWLCYKSCSTCVNLTVNQCSFFLIIGLAETLLCVICSSDSDPECEDDPKSPSPCPESQQRSACQTVREKNVKGTKPDFFVI